MITQEQFEDLYSKGFLRTVKVFRKYVDEQDAFEYAQDVYARIWEKQKAYKPKYSLVYFWQLQLRDVLYDSMGKRNRRVPLSPISDTKMEASSSYEPNWDMELDTGKLLDRLPEHLASFLILRANGFSGPEAAEIVNEDRGVDVTDKSYYVAIRKLINKSPDIMEDVEAILKE